MAAAHRCIGSRQAVPFVAPAWAAHLRSVPAARLQLGHFPTPVVRWRPLEPAPGWEGEFWLKRDDMTGMELAGNKVRKLEFLLEEAVREGADCVISCGGMQSNHCRAVAVACTSLGLESHLVLRHEDWAVEDDAAAVADVGMQGNLLVDRLVGAKIWVVTKKEYREQGSEVLMERVRAKLAAEGRKPYIIKLGGSSPLGTWGYIDAFEEMRQQAEQMFGKGQGFSDIVIATGSGGSLAGIALANKLTGFGAKVWGFGANDTSEYHHSVINSQILPGLLPDGGPAVRSEDIAEITNAKNLGYAMTTPEELDVIRALAARTGIFFDPVYTGKAFRFFAKLYTETPERFGKRILFWHTGGMFGLWDKQAEFRELVERHAPGDVSAVPRL